MCESEGGLETYVQSKEITVSHDLTAAQDRKHFQFQYMKFQFQYMKCFQGNLICDHEQENSECI